LTNSALIIGAYVRGLSDRDIESLLQEAGLGKLSKSTASRICQELRERYRAFRARSLAEVKLLVLFLDAIYLPTRPSGAKEGVLVAWGYTEAGERILLDVCLGLRERYEDWLEMGRGLTRRGLDRARPAGRSGRSHPPALAGGALRPPAGAAIRVLSSQPRWVEAATRTWGRAVVTWRFPHFSQR